MPLDDGPRRRSDPSEQRGIDEEERGRADVAERIITQARERVGPAARGERPGEVRGVDQQRRDEVGGFRVGKDRAPRALDRGVIEDREGGAVGQDERDRRSGAVRVDDPRVRAPRFADRLRCAEPGGEPSGRFPVG